MTAEIEFVFWSEAEDRIALEFRYCEWWSDSLDDPIEEAAKQWISLGDKRAGRHVGGVDFCHGTQEGCVSRYIS